MHIKAENTITNTVKQKGHELNKSSCPFLIVF